MSMKVGENLNFLVGFNEFASWTSIGAISSGVTPTVLSWKVSDGAAALSAAMLLAVSYLLI